MSTHRLALVLLTSVAAAGVLGTNLQADEATKAPTPRPNALSALAEQFGFQQVGTKTTTTLKIGDTFPAMRCLDLQGKPVDMESLWGEKATLVVCWSTTCGPCMAALPHEAKLTRQYLSKGLKVIGVNGDRDPKLAQRVIDGLRINWNTIHEPQGDEQADGFVKTLKIKSWPTVLLFDADRKLLMATPYLDGTIVTTIGGNAFAVCNLDIALTKLLGPLEGVPFISAVN